VSAPVDTSLAAIAAAAKARDALCNGHVASWLDADGALVARCSRCGRGSRWTAQEVAAWGMTSGLSFAPCDARR
jgi:hypothetical protein